MKTPEGQAITPREWLADLPLPWPPTASLANGEAVNACYTITQIAESRTRQPEPVLRLQLADCYGRIDAYLAGFGIDRPAKDLSQGSEDARKPLREASTS